MAGVRVRFDDAVGDRCADGAVMAQEAITLTRRGAHPSAVTVTVMSPARVGRTMASARPSKVVQVDPVNGLLLIASFSSTSRRIGDTTFLSSAVSETPNALTESRLGRESASSSCSALAHHERHAAIAALDKDRLSRLAVRQSKPAAGHWPRSRLS